MKEGDGMKMNMPFSSAISIRRIEKELSLKDLGNLTGIEPSYIYRLESGQRQNPTVQTVFMLSQALELDFMYLVKIIMGQEKEKSVE